MESRFEISSSASLPASEAADSRSLTVQSRRHGFRFASESMGLFSSLFGRSDSNVQHLGDRLWISHQAKMAAIGRDVNDRINDGAAAVLLVGHFDSTCQQLHEIVETIAVDHPLSVVCVDELETRFSERPQLDESVQIDMIVAERHLLATEDERLIQFAQQLPCRCRIGQHVSIDDPLLDIFVGETVRNMLEAMGVSENESIDSPMVTRRIKAVQQKIAARAVGNTRTGSATEWIAMNLPGGP